MRQVRARDPRTTRSTCTGVAGNWSGNRRRSVLVWISRPFGESRLPPSAPNLGVAVANERAERRRSSASPGSSLARFGSHFRPNRGSLADQSGPLWFTVERMGCIGRRVGVMIVAGTILTSACRSSPDKGPTATSPCPSTEQEAAFLTTELVPLPTRSGALFDAGSEQRLKVAFQCVPVGNDGRCAEGRVLVVIFDTSRRICDDRGAVESLAGQPYPSAEAKYR